MDKIDTTFRQWTQNFELLKHTQDIALGQSDKCFVLTNKGVLVFQSGLYIGHFKKGNTQKLAYPYIKHIDIDKKGNLYAAGNHVIYCFNSDGCQIGQWCSPKNFYGNIGKILFDGQGGVYFWDAEQHLLICTDYSGNIRSRLGEVNDLPSFIKDPKAVARNSDGDIFIADAPNHRIYIFRSDGTPVERVKAVINNPYSLAADLNRKLLFVLQNPGDAIDSPVIEVFGDKNNKLSYYKSVTSKPLKKHSGPLYADKYPRYLRPPNFIAPIKGNYAPFSVLAVSNGYLYLVHRREGRILRFSTEEFVDSSRSIDSNIGFYCSHREVISRANYEYKVTLGGTLDAEVTECAGRSRKDPHVEPAGFQPNESLTITNTGKKSVKNPRVIVNSRHNWFSIEDILKEIIKPGMTDREKAFLLWNFCRKNFRYGVAAHTLYPPVTESVTKFLNCGGTGSCGTQYYFVRLARAAGMKAEQGGTSSKVLGGFGHTIARFFYNGENHYFDNTLINGPYHLSKSRRGVVPLRLDNKTVASAEDLIDDIYLFFRMGKLPNPAGLGPTQKECLYYGRGLNYPCIWKESSVSYEDPHDMSFILYPNESITWYWSFFGKHIGTFRPTDCVVNGKMTYRPDFMDQSHRQGLLLADNIIFPCDNKTLKAGEDQPMVFVADPARPGFLTYKVQCPYPVVGGRVGGKFYCDKKSMVRIFISFNGTLWERLWEASQTGYFEHYEAIDHIDAFEHHKTFCFEHNETRDGPPVYEYYLRIELVDGGANKGVGVSCLLIDTDFIANDLSLPALTCGNNLIRYSDDTNEFHELTITHQWKESQYADRPLPPSEPEFPKNKSCVCGSGFIFRWKTSEDQDGDTIVDYEFRLGTRSDLAWPLAPCFETFINDGRPVLENPGPTFFNPGTTYYWQVRALNKHGVWSEWSKTWSFIYNGPAKVQADGYKIKNGRVCIKWKPGVGGTEIDHYEVYASKEEGFIPTAESFKIFNGKEKVEYPANLLTTTIDNFLSVISQEKIGEESLQPRVYYRVIAVDIEGNRSCPSECIAIPHPFIYSSPPVVAKRGLVYNYQARVTCAGPEIQYWQECKKAMEYHTDVLSFDLIEGPEWLSIDSERGLLSGVVPSNTTTEYMVVLKVIAVRKSNLKEVIGEDKQEFQLAIK